MTADDIRLEIASSRRAIQADCAALRQELDFATKTKRAIIKHPLQWLGGAAFIGYILSGRKKSRESRRKNRGGSEFAAPAKRLTLLGVILAAARVLFPLARPALTAFAVRKISSFAGRFQ